MATKKILVHVDLNQNELQNAVIQNLATAPANPVAGQHYFNTTDHIEYIWDGTKWVDAMSQGDYTFENGVEEGANRHVAIKLAQTQGNVTLTANADGLKAEVAEASADAKGIIEIATDAEAEAGTSEILAVNPKQLQTKVTANADITAATKCKITYDEKGLVTAGADLIPSDIPALDSSKITTLNNYAKGTVADVATTDTLDQALGKLEAKADEKVVANAAITAGTGTVITYDAKGLVTGSSEIVIDAGSTNYLEFDTTAHSIKAKVDTAVTDGSTKLVTSGAVASAIDAAIVGGVMYQGSWDITSATDYSGITLPVKQGYLYYVKGTGPKTIGGIEWNEGDYLLVNEDVAAGGSLVGKVEKIDNTEAADLVRLDATQTLTNKTIDADSNTISNLETDNFKSGVIVTSVQASASASDTALPTEKAVALAIEAADAALPHKFTATNEALTATAGVCSWTVTHNLGSADVLCTVKEVASNAEVIAEVDYTSNNALVVKFNSAANIAAGTYKVVVIG